MKVSFCKPCSDLTKQHALLGHLISKGVPPKTGLDQAKRISTPLTHLHLRDLSLDQPTRRRPNPIGHMWAKHVKKSRPKKAMTSTKMSPRTHTHTNERPRALIKTPRQFWAMVMVLLVTQVDDHPYQSQEKGGLDHGSRGHTAQCPNLNHASSTKALVK